MILRVSENVKGPPKPIILDFGSIRLFTSIRENSQDHVWEIPIAENASICWITRFEKARAGRPWDRSDQCLNLWKMGSISSNNMRLLSLFLDSTKESISLTNEIRRPPLRGPPGCGGSCVVPFPMYHVSYVASSHSQDSQFQSQDLESQVSGILE